MTLPPTSVRPNRFASGRMPFASLRASRSLSFAGSASAQSHQRGTAPIAARSERFVASALWPMSSSEKNGRVKCTPSTSASVVMHKPRSSTAASSPGPRGARAWGSAATKRSMKSNSPLTFLGRAEEDLTCDCVFRARAVALRGRETGGRPGEGSQRSRPACRLAARRSRASRLPCRAAAPRGFAASSSRSRSPPPPVYDSALEKRRDPHVGSSCLRSAKRSFRHARVAPIPLTSMLERWRAAALNRWSVCHGARVLLAGQDPWRR